MEGLIFIKPSNSVSSHIDTRKIGFRIIDEIFKNEKNLCRFTNKFIPVEFLAKASQEEANIKWIEKAVNEYFDRFKGKGGTTWSLEFKARGNKSIDRESYLDVIYKLINTENSGNSVDLKNAEHSVIIEVIWDAMVFAIVPKFKEYKKYNLTYWNTFEENNNEEEIKKEEKVVETKME